MACNFSQREADAYGPRSFAPAAPRWARSLTFLGRHRKKIRARLSARLGDDTEAQQRHPCQWRSPAIHVSISSGSCRCFMSDRSSTHAALVAIGISLGMGRASPFAMTRPSKLHENETSLYTNTPRRALAQLTVHPDLLLGRRSLSSSSSRRWRRCDVRYASRSSPSRRCRDG